MEHCLTQFQIIPNRIIFKNNNYANRKIIINKKFQWLNKYLSAATPHMLNLSTFTLYNNRFNPEKSKSRSLVNRSRLKTSNQNTEREGILRQSDSNHCEMRKINSTQLKRKDVFKLTQNSSQFKSLKNKKTKSQFCKLYKNNIQNQPRIFEFKKIRNQIQDSQIKPWNYDNNNDQEILYFKQNQKPILR